MLCGQEFILPQVTGKLSFLVRTLEYFKSTNATNATPRNGNSLRKLQWRVVTSKNV